MTTLEQANEAIAQTFQTAWLPTGYVFALENESFDPPDDSPWARLTVRHTGATQDTLGSPGNRRFDRTGSVFIQIFVKSDTGTRLSKQLTETTVNAFEGNTISGTTITFLDVIPRETGVDRGWFQTVVEATFRYFEIK